jgi:hypothetical protein
MAGDSLLCDVAVLYTLDSHPMLTAAERREIKSIVMRYLKSDLPYNAALALYEAKFGTTAPIERVREILEVSDRPLPPDPRSLSPDNSLRQKTR